MKKGKKALSIFLVVITLVLCAPISFASEIIYTSYGDSGIGETEDERIYIRCTLDNEGLLTVHEKTLDISMFDVPEEYRTQITSILVQDGVKVIDNRAFEDCINLTSVTIPNSVTRIGHAAFMNCSSLTSVIIPNGVIDLSAFWGCSNLTNVTIGNGVTRIDGNAFNDCTSLSNLTIGNNVTEIGGSAFSNCEALTDVTIPESVTSIGDGAFSGCINLSNLTIGNKVAEIGNFAFGCCYSLSSVTIPNSVTSIGDSAFSSCSSLKSIEIPNGVTRINNRTFADCDNLTSITIPNSVTSFGDYAFGGCTSLSSIEIPNRVTDIGTGAFCICSSLISITIPNSVTRIGEYAFQYCDNLKTIHFIGTKQQWVQAGGFFSNLIDFRFAFIISLGEKLLIPSTIPSDFENADEVFWTSSDEKVATVNKDGLVASRGKEGITKITLTAKLDGVTYTDYCNVIVRGYNSGVYSLGEETYGFRNWGDGYCFGMAVTSSMFHLGLLDRSFLGEESKSLYDQNLTKELQSIICSYNSLQKTYNSKAIVAGGFYFRDNVFDFLINYLINTSPLDPILNRVSEREWDQIIHFVQSHNYDNKGNLVIGFEIKKINEKGEVVYGGGHAINFLRYEIVNGEKRIYTYDSNRPETETYLFKASDGTIKYEPYSNYQSIYNITLVDADKFYYAANGYKKTQAVYAYDNNIVVENAKASCMWSETVKGSRQIMYELPDDISQVRIVPLVDDAEFTYMDQTYHIHREDENTIGILTLAETEDDTGFLAVINDPDNHVHIYTAELSAEPTCSDKGAITCTCTRCNDTYTETIDALGHYDNDDDNLCDDCGEPMPQEHTHVYTSAVTSEATCTKSGVRTFTCIDGDDTYTEPINPLGHAYVNHNAQTPTCTEKGWDAYQTCSRCDCDYTTYKEKAALGHIDAINDGKCDRCKKQMTGGDHCKYCGEVHEGFFDKIVGFFHSILALFGLRKK